MSEHVCVCVREREGERERERNQDEKKKKKKNQSQNLGKEMIKDKRASMLGNKCRTNKMTSLAN